MPDISMCENHACPLRVDCYRYRAFPSHRQTYGTFMPVDGKCDHFWLVDMLNHVRSIAEIEKEAASGA